MCESDCSQFLVRTCLHNDLVEVEHMPLYQLADNLGDIVLAEQ